MGVWARRFRGSNRERTNGGRTPPQLRSIQPEVIFLAGGGVSKDTEGIDLNTNEYVGWYEI